MKKKYISPEIKLYETHSNIICSSNNPSGYWEDTHHNDQDPNPYWHGRWGQDNNPSDHRNDIWGRDK